MIFLPLFVYASEVAIVIDDSQTLTLSGNHKLLEHVLNHLSLHITYSVIDELPYFKVIGNEYAIKLRRAPKQFIEAKAYVKSVFGEHELFYNDDGKKTFVMDQSSYDIAIAFMQNPVFYIENNDSLSRYLKKNEEHMEENIRETFQIVIEETDVGFEAINFSYLSFDDQQFAHLSQILPYLNGLGEFDISGNHLSEQSSELVAKSLKYLNSLVKLGLSSCDIDFKAMKNIAEHLDNTKLTELNIASNPLQASGAMQLNILLRNLPNLSNLDISYCELDDEAFSLLDNLQNIHILHLSGNQITQRGFVLLKERIDLEQVVELDIGDIEFCNNFQDAVLFLSGLTNVVKLGLSKNMIDDSKLVILVSVLESLEHLKVLDLSENAISDVSSLSRLKSKLSGLDLSGNDLNLQDEYFLDSNQPRLIYINDL